MFKNIAFRMRVSRTVRHVGVRGVEFAVHHAKQKGKQMSPATNNFWQSLLPTAFMTLVVLIFGCLPGVLSAQYDFFWSDRNLHEDAINSDLDIFAPSGGQVTLYLYYTTNGPSNSNLRRGGFIDLTTSANDIIEFTKVETFDFAILNSTSWKEKGFNRLLDQDGSGGAVGSTALIYNNGNSVEQLLAYTTVGPGIDEINTGTGKNLDAGYDAQSDAFLWAAIQINVVGEVGDEVDISVPYSVMIDMDEEVFPTFGSLRITVDPPVQKGDVNRDGLVNLVDVNHFVEVLTSNTYLNEADINCDGTVSLLDVNPFARLLVNIPE